ncbi:MAG: mitochondrial fission ELM1 family protein, partial [Robiginitomaculum sp.]|nr:mitochondrial fission ELM1 family protein [Robiginitomaculum sp.]
MSSNFQSTNIGSENYDNILRGKKGWIVTSGYIGNMVQCEGIMEALGLEIEYKTVNPSAPWRYFAPWGPVSPKTQIGGTTGQFAGPLPEIIIGSSRQAVPYMRALKKHCDHRTLTVFLQNPIIGTKAADLIWVSDHDSHKINGENVISSLLAPHRITQKRLDQARKSGNLDMTVLTSPCIAISVGGSNSVYNYNSKTCERFAHYLSKAAQSGASFLVTPSRRTDAGIIEVIAEAIKSAPHHIWDGSGDNPYFEYLSQCDALIVTADSVNMAGEAIATGKPVYIFHPQGGSKKFDYFHDQLRKKGITRN